jgi:ABC-2 type transport system ATP-binding protein
MNAPAIDCRHLTHRYGDFTAVDDLSLNVDVGETLGLLGPNGAGKTTVVRLVGIVSASALLRRLVA